MFPVSQVRPAHTPAWRRVLPFAALAAMALVAVFFLPDTLLAQLPDVKGVSDGLKLRVAPLIFLARVGVVIACLVVGIFEGYKAAKGGQASGWLKFVALLIMAGIAASPVVVTGLLGLNDIKTAVTGWGIFDTGSAP